LESAVRKAAVAGTWYPGHADAIVSEVESYLAACAPVAPGRLVGIVSPHAGLRYSGPVAAHAYALLRGRTEATVVLVGPSHRVAFEGCGVWSRGSFETPLGRAPVDEELAAALVAAEPRVREMPGPHREEHSLEMQLPFLQHLVSGLRVVPILMGSQERDEVEALAAALARVLSSRPALLVASSDLSHYQPAAVASVLDARVVGHVERFDADGLMALLDKDRLEERVGYACGGGPMVAVMKATKALGANSATVLRRADSGDVAYGDKSAVVGYLAAAFTEAA
jgi:AmmeMemoRadiSam system protein B